MSSSMAISASRCLLVALLSAILALAGPAPAPGAPPGQDPEWPLRPAPDVLHRFQPPADPWGAGHRGVDLLGTAGQPVRAALAGQVRFAGRLAGRGVVVVDHGPTRTTYEPVTATLPVGELVAAGDPIGTLETVGSHCFPRACLHWGWIRGETYLDPLDLVGAGPVRLLPLWRTEPVWDGTGRTLLPPYAGWRPSITGPSWLG